MSKPILIIGIPGNHAPAEFNEIESMINSKIKNDYHVIIFQKNSTDIEFEAFCGKNIKDVEIEELKKSIMEKMKE